MPPAKQIRSQTHRVSAPRAAGSTRGKLIEAAGDVFAEHGYQATTVREIVKWQGASKPLFSNVAARLRRAAPSLSHLFFG